MSEDKIAGLNTVKVDAWGTGDRNDCYWNIAANQLGEDATAQEIQALCEQLQAYNQEKSATIQKQSETLNAGDQVFIPLEYAMDEITNNVSTKQGEVTTAQGELETAQGELSTASGEVNSTLSAYNSAMAAYQNAAEDADNKGELQSAMETAKQAYLAAVQKQEEAQAKVTEKQEEVETKKSELEQYKSELEELKQEYADEKEEYETELSQLQEQIDSIDTSIKETETSLEQAKAEQQAATSQQEDAQTLGVTKNEDGTYSLDDSNLTPEQLQAATINSESAMTAVECAGKEVEDSDVIDGGRTKVVRYKDGTSAEFYKDPETGEWSSLPGIIYDGEGGVTYTGKVTEEDVANGNVPTNDDEGAETGEAALRSSMAEARAQQLFAAMDGFGTNEDAVRQILENVSGQDLVDVMEMYEEKYGESLTDAIRGDFSFLSGESELIGYLNSAKNYASVAEREEVTEESVLDAQVEAFDTATVDKWGTNEQVLNDMITGMSDEELVKFAEHYKQKTGKDITDVIKDETSFEQEDMLLSRIDSARKNIEKADAANEGEEGQTDELTDEEKAAQEEAALRSDMANARASTLHAAMDRLGTDEDAVREILENVAGQDLVDVMEAYEEIYGESLTDAIKDDFSFLSGESELIGYLNSAKNYASVAEREEITAESVAEAQAKAFEEATSARLGTDEDVVYNMLNNGMLSDEAIINLANTLSAQGKDIVQMIKDDFSGDIRRTLLNKLEELGIYKDE